MHIARSSLVFALLIAACGKPQGDSNVPVTGAGEQVYFSAANPGKWRDHAVDHQVATSVSEKADYLSVRVEVPLKVSSDHFVEAIVLVDNNNRELAKHAFARNDKPIAEFSLAEKETRNGVFAVAKCNLHDMWRTKVR